MSLSDHHLLAGHKRLPAWFVEEDMEPGPLQHPWKWVQCFSCAAIVPMVMGSGGRSELPYGWSIIRPVKDGKVVVEVYASPDCTHRATTLASMQWDTHEVRVSLEVL
jgi:hypothetical protein